MKGKGSDKKAAKVAKQAAEHEAGAGRLVVAVRKPPTGQHCYLTSGGDKWNNRAVEEDERDAARSRSPRTRARTGTPRVLQQQPSPAHKPPIPRRCSRNGGIARRAACRPFRSWGRRAFSFESLRTRPRDERLLGQNLLIWGRILGMRILDDMCGPLHYMLKVPGRMLACSARASDECC